MGGFGEKQEKREDRKSGSKRISFLVYICKEGRHSSSHTRTLYRTCSHIHTHHTHTHTHTFIQSHATVAEILSGLLSATMPPRNAFAMHLENCTLRGNSLFRREREFPEESIFGGIDRRVFHITFVRSRERARILLPGSSLVKIYRPQARNSSGRAIELAH